MQWLLVSVVVSVVLTVALNVALRLFPGASDRVARGVADLTSPNRPDRYGSEARVRVFAPWKAMLLGSLILTVVINIVFWLT